MTTLPEKSSDVATGSKPAFDWEQFKRGWIIPCIIGTALLMQTLNATSISNALPAMARDLGVTPIELNTAITAHMLAMAIFLPISGWLADRFGAKRIFMVSMVLYAISSMLCGFAQSFNQLIAARILQGFGGAMLAPVGRLVLVRTTPKAELVGAMSMLTVPALLGGVVGPILGGAIVTFASWHWIFFLNIPLALVALILVRLFIPNVKEQEVPQIDWIGMVLTGACLGGFIYGFQLLSRPTIDVTPLAVSFGVGLVCLLIYLLHARRIPNAAVDLSIFSKISFRTAVIGMSCNQLMPATMAFLLAMLLQVGFGLSALVAGLLTFISAIGSLAMKSVAPPTLRRFGFRTVLIGNGLICATTFVVMSVASPATPHWLIMVVLGLGGFFRSLQFTTLNGLIYADLESAEVSRGSTTAAMAQQFMASVALGLAATLVALMSRLRGEGVLTWQAVSPVFAILGVATLVAMFWYVRLPHDAGDDLSGRRRP